MTQSADEIPAASPAPQIRVRSTQNPIRPIALAIGTYDRPGRGGSAHGVLLTREGAMGLLYDMANELGLTVSPAPARRWTFRSGMLRPTSLTGGGRRG